MSRVTGAAFAAKQNAEVETFVAAEEAEAGKVEMSEKFREGGAEICITR